jgi:putative hemolysin
MGSMTGVMIEVLVIVLLLIGNGVLSMSEMAIVSARKARLRRWVEEGNPRAKDALELANSPNDFLSTVQIGITSVGILAGAFGGATIAEQIAELITFSTNLDPYADAIGLAIVVATITYFSLLIGELVPKRIALQSPELISTLVARPMRAIMMITSPLVALLSGSTATVVRLLGVKPSNDPPITDAEIHVLIDEGKRAGVFEESEQEMIASVLKLGDRQIHSLMTPRTELVWLDSKDDQQQIVAKLYTTPHSLLPVAEGKLDNILGYVETRDILLAWGGGDKLDIRAFIKEPLYVPESKSALSVLKSFRETRTHIALVMDEFGGLQGLVTVHNLVEAIVGSLPTPTEQRWQVTKRDDNSWLMDGMTPIDHFKDVLQLHELPDQEDDDYQTVAGFVLSQLGRVPEVGEKLKWEKLSFEIVDMDGHRIDKVLVSKLH